MERTPCAASALTEPSFRIAGTKLGAGRRQLVLLHGWGQSSSDWMPVAELLAPHATIHLVDLPGFGASQAPDPGWGTKECAAIVSDYLHDVGINGATLVGHSFGARIALRIADADPGFVRSLVLVSAAGLPGARPFGMRAKLRALSAARRALGFLEPILGERPLDAFRRRFGSRDFQQAGALRSLLVRAVGEDLTTVAQGVVCPTLLVWGDRDAETPLSMGKRYRELIRDSKLVVLPRRGHFPHHGIGSHLCAELIRRYS